MIKEYIAYAKQNPEGYWFKAKLYGFGWAPVTWQGWVVLLIYVCLVFLLTLTIHEDSSVRDVLLHFVLPIVALTGILIGVCYKTGEKPHWQWGPPRSEKLKKTKNHQT